MDSLGNAYKPKNYVTTSGYSAYAEYNVRQSYTKISGKIAPHESLSEGYDVVLKIYADDAIVYTSPKITRTTYAIDFSESFPKDTKILKIACEGPGGLLLLDFTLS